MRKFNRFILMFLAMCTTILSIAQETVTVSGSVKNSKSKEILSAVSVTIKGTSYGTFTDEKGNYKLTTTQKLPFTLVISSVGYADKEVAVTSNNQVINVDVDTKYSIGDEVVVAASRTPERILESPVSIERVSAAKIRQSPAVSYYDILGTQKGVDIMASSLTFKTISTRGFVSSGNLRLNQLVDGMDNQAPGLNFSVGSVAGLTELDVDNMELLAGASSALYGSGGMNGTLLINSKDPFKYQGFSFQIKQGATHVDRHQRSNASAYYDWSMRWAKKISEKFAFKITGQFTQAKDWVGTDNRNYSRATGSPNGEVKGGDRSTDPNYDGVNVYGDETTQNMSNIAATATASVPSTVIAASNSYLAANPNATLTQFNSFLTAIGAGAVVSAGGSPFVYGNSPSRNYFNNQSVSRTGYDERDLIDPTTLNFKVSGALVYKIARGVDASLSTNFGTGNTVYTGIDRYSLKNLKIAQHKFELKAKNWFLRAYTTQENAGESFAVTTTTRLFNEAWKPSQTWYPQYMTAYVTARSSGVAALNAHNSARTFADQGRPTGDIKNNATFKKIASTPLSKNGGLFLDKSDLYAVEGQYNLTDLMGIKKAGWDVMIGGNWKRYVLNSEGTLFSDSTGTIGINEMGGYVQIKKALFNNKLKLSASGRYDKNDNFKGRFTPRASAVVEVAKNHNVRLSYQTAYRFPSTQNQYINLNTAQGRLMGGLPEFRDYYKFNERPAYTLASVQAFGAALQAGGAAAFPTAVTLLKVQQFPEFKPESLSSYELGYKGLIGEKLLIDVYAYYAEYKDFIGNVSVIQTVKTTSTNPASPLQLDLLNPATGAAATRNIYNIPINLDNKVKSQGYGISLEYLLPMNFSVTGNFYSDELKDVPTGVATYFNSPKYRTNIGLTNTGLLYNKRIGFSLNWRWQDAFYYEGTFGAGNLPAFSTWDGMISYKMPECKSLIKLGATNFVNKYNRGGWGNPQQGGLYYISYGYNL